MSESPGEKVADLTESPRPEEEREPRYVSRYRKEVERSAKRGKSAHQTLGVPRVYLNPPTQYLKKNSSTRNRRPEVHHKHYHRPGYQHKLPEWKPLRATDSQFRENEARTIDFTKRNIDEAKKLKPFKPRKYYVDDRRGNAHPLRNSGLFPVYRNRKNYGQFPGSYKQHSQSAHEGRKRHEGEESRPRSRREERSYAERSRKDQSKSKEEAEESSSSSRPHRPKCRYVTEDEREELLHGMKKKWDEMMKQFQCLPFLTDTPPKVKRKSNLEKELQKLEKDIEVIERHPYIYVYSDSDGESRG